MKCVALFVAPGIVAIFVRDEHSFEEWSWAYLTNAIMLIVVGFLLLDQVSGSSRAVAGFEGSLRLHL